MVDCGKILIEGMDLSGKSTITADINSLTNIKRIKQRTLSDQTSIYDFTVAQSKLGYLSQELISKLYCLAINEDLENYKITESGIVLQDSYFALRSYALACQNKDFSLSDEIYSLLRKFPKPELSFYLTATTEERIKRNLNRDKPMAYMEKMLMSNPKKFEGIEECLRNGVIELFNAEVIDTSKISHNEVAEYISKKIKERRVCEDERVY